MSEAEREAVIADTLAGAPEAKSEWTERGMVAELAGSPAAFTGPVRVIVGEKDLVEPEDRVRSIFGVIFPAAEVTMAGNAGHLLPIEAPSVIVVACRSLASERK